MKAPHCVPGDSDFVKTLLSSYERYTGVKGQPMSTGGGTYVHNLERGVAFGCGMEGVDNHMHGDDEFWRLTHADERQNFCRCNCQALQLMREK